MTTHSQFLIRKASGESEPFDVSKLIRSLQKAGAEPHKAESIANVISSSLYEGISTKKIYGMAFRMLKKQDRNHALLYKLKQSLFELGPTGYPFEQFIGEVYKKRGFSVEVAQILEGYSITHEMDVIATKNREQLFIECKYGNDQGKTISIQVPLYVRSRVNDIAKESRDAGVCKLHILCRTSLQHPIFGRLYSIQQVQRNFASGVGLSPRQGIERDNGAGKNLPDYRAGTTHQPAESVAYGTRRCYLRAAIFEHGSLTTLINQPKKDAQH